VTLRSEKKNVEEAINTLRFAQRAKAVSATVMKNEDARKPTGAAAHNKKLASELNSVRRGHSNRTAPERPEEKRRSERPTRAQGTGYSTAPERPEEKRRSERPTRAQGTGYMSRYPRKLHLLCHGGNEPLAPTHYT